MNVFQSYNWEDPAVIARVAHVREKLADGRPLAPPEASLFAAYVDRLERLADQTVDPVTGLPHQVGRGKALREAVADAQHSGYGVSTITAVFLVDGDRLKWVNDTYGHLAGNAVIQGTAAYLRTHLRKETFLSREGGDEFFGLERRVSDLTGFVGHVNAIRAGYGDGLQDYLKQHGFAAVAKEHRTLSIGLTLLTPADTWDSAYQRADRALYRAKALGRNRLYLAIPRHEDLRRFAS